MPGFTLRKHSQQRFDAVLSQLPGLLQEEGFGVLTRIDVADTLKQKIGVDFRRYQILGACNPKLAHRVLSTDLEVGAMLPCNVVVYEGDDGGTVVLAIDPLQAIAAANPAVRPVAEEVRARLVRVLERVS
ncbi:MAG TPA: DUF302 domain-containing protein [Anaeromyxobacteraceae bacterium]|nr:DUF302 domain-containing protein [Anaeromyxobacteraceae bacterium]